MIQIRNVPEDVHCRLKACAAMAGMPAVRLPAEEISAVAARRNMEEMRERLATRSRVETGESAADAIRAICGHRHDHGRRLHLARCAPAQADCGCHPGEAARLGTALHVPHLLDAKNPPKRAVTC
jgi:plasmid stability protein